LGLEELAGMEDTGWVQARVVAWVQVVQVVWVEELEGLDGHSRWCLNRQ